MVVVEVVCTVYKLFMFENGRREFYCPVNENQQEVPALHIMHWTLSAHWTEHRQSIDRTRLEVNA